VGRRGDADVVFVHDQAAEEEFVAQGFEWWQNGDGWSWISPPYVLKLDNVAFGVCPDPRATP
jgi:hypothetical protein